MNNELTLPFDGRLAISSEIDRLVRIKDVIIFREITPGNYERLIISVPNAEENIFNTEYIKPDLFSEQDNPFLKSPFLKIKRAGQKDKLKWLDVKLTAPSKGRGYFKQDITLNIEIEFDPKLGLVEVTSDGFMNTTVVLLDGTPGAVGMHNHDPRVLFGGYVVEYEITTALNQTE